MKLGKAYKILEVSRFASFEKINEQYKKLSKKYHPDLTKDNDSVEKFKEVQEAYETICNNAHIRSNQYQSEKKQEEPMGHRGGDIFANVNVTFKEAALGCEKNTTIKRLQKCVCDENERSTCPLCHGSGKLLKDTFVRIKIPRGVFDTQSIIIREKGHDGDKGCKNGDLIVNIHILPDEYYSRRGLNVYSKDYISFADACIGTNKIIETIYGSVTFKIPPGREYPHTISLKGRGIIDASTGEVGNHYVTYYIQVPTELTDEEKELLEKLKK